MNWTISRQILVGYVVSLIFVLLIGLAAYRESHDMLVSFEKRGQAGEITRRADELLSLLQEAESGQRGFLLTGADRYEKPYKQSKDALPAIIDKFEKAIQAGGLDGASFTELRAKISEKLAELDRTVELRRTSGFDAAVQVVSTDEGKVTMERIRELLGNVKQNSRDAYEASNKEAHTSAHLFQLVLEIGLPVTFVVMLVIGIVTARSISRPVNEMASAAHDISSGNLNVSLSQRSTAEELRSLAKSFAAMVAALKQSAAMSKRIAAGDLAVEVRAQSEADVVGQAQAEMVNKLSELIEQVQHAGLQVNSSAVEIAATGKQQQSTASEMASTTTEISATAKEMSATSTELLKAADNVNMVSQQLAGLASSGKDGLERMERIMRQIMEASSSITTRLGEMNDKAGTIGSVVTTITKIADQTNLLSLNAAIEAEKAGEYGRGFSVVAAEIRRLADQTAASTLDIEQMVKEMLGSVSAGVMGMDKFSEEVRRSAREVEDVSRQIDQMIERVQSIAPSMESVYEGMQAQTQGAGQISDALAQLGEAARQTADSIRDSNRAVEQLNDASRGLQAAISRFKLR